MNPVVVRGVKIGEGMPKICVPIIGSTRADILQAAEEIRKVPADLVEWRADWFESVYEIEEVREVLAELRVCLRDIPILFTFRTKAEGGEKEIGFRGYLQLLKDVAATGLADMVDVEVFFNDAIKELVLELQGLGVKVVGSNHDFQKTPSKEEIIRRLCHMQELGVDIPKIAVMPQNKKDVRALLHATEEMVSQYADRPIITMSMAGVGAISRISGELFGSAVTFGAMNQASAPGQIHVNQLKIMLEALHCEL